VNHVLANVQRLTLQALLVRAQACRVQLHRKIAVEALAGLYRPAPIIFFQDDLKIAFQIVNSHVQRRPELPARLKSPDSLQNPLLIAHRKLNGNRSLVELSKGDGHGKMLAPPH